MVNRVGLQMSSYFRKLSPLALMMGANRNTIRQARVKLQKEYPKDETSKETQIMRFETALKKRTIDDAEKAFAEVALIAVHEIQSNAESLKLLILPIVDDFRKLKDIQKLEDVPQLKQVDEDIMRLFLTETQHWFSNIATHNSLTIQLSDVVSLRQEVLHILDRWNEMKKQRAVDKDLAVVKKKARKPKKSEPEVLDEAKVLEKLKKDSETYLKALDIIWADMTKLMLLEVDKNNKLLDEWLKELYDSGFHRRVPNRYKALQETYSQIQKKTEGQFKSVGDTLNALIILEKTR